MRWYADRRAAARPARGTWPRRGLTRAARRRPAQRFTPCFTITEEDIEKVIVPVLDEVLAANL